jgi:glycosyltransferase involved in cell wall biosynthesis
MNILFLNSAKKWGGNENWIKLITQALEKKEGFSGLLAYRREEVGDKFNTVKFRLPFQHFADIKTIIKLIKIVRTQNIKVLITTKQKDYVLAGVVSRICGIKNILRLGIVRSLRQSFIYRLVYHVLCDGIIVNAQKIKEILLDTPFIHPERVDVIYNGIDVENIQSKAREKKINRPFKFMICASGMLIPRKRFEILLQSFAQMVQENMNLNAGIYILGDGIERDRLQTTCVKLGIAERVIFLGFRQNPFPYVKDCDVFVITSQNEGISNVMLEAMALKVPIITTDCGGAGEAIEHEKSGLIVNKDEIYQLKVYISDLLKNPQKRKVLSDTAFDTVCNKFSTAQMIDKFVSFCQAAK